MRYVKGIAGHKYPGLSVWVALLFNKEKNAIFLVMFSDFRRCADACNRSGLVLSVMLFYPKIIANIE